MAVAGLESARISAGGTGSGSGAAEIVVEARQARRSVLGSVTRRLRFRGRER
jgi:cell division GTPase FtsZ